MLYRPQKGGQMKWTLDEARLRPDKKFLDWYEEENLKPKAMIFDKLSTYQLFFSQHAHSKLASLALHILDATELLALFGEQDAVKEFGVWAPQLVLCLVSGCAMICVHIVVTFWRSYRSGNNHDDVGGQIFDLIFAAGEIIFSSQQ